MIEGRTGLHSMDTSGAIGWFQQFQSNIISVGTTSERDADVLQATRLALSALKKRQDYRWHDIRANEDDLPLKDLDIEVVNDDGIHHIAVLKETDDDYYEWFIKYCLYDRDVWDTAENGEIIAWRYIEPFE